LENFPDEVQEHISQKKCPFTNSQKDASSESLRP
jgi:hypothetical protein